MDNTILFGNVAANPHDPNTSSNTPLERNRKRYELTNHLGNVLAVITDRKRARSAAGSAGAAAEWFEAEVMSAQQYYAFGALMPGDPTSAVVRRQYSLGGYDHRYGFNGKEGDDEVSGDDNQQDYGMRYHDPRVGRFLSVDPIVGQYPELTPYQFASNRPIEGIDLDGLEFENYRAAQIVKERGVAALPVAKVENGFGNLQEQRYSLKIRGSRERFAQFKDIYTTHPELIHNPNNLWAVYKPLENTNDNDQYLGVGDHMYIDILGPFDDYVRFSNITLTENSFSIRAETLLGHTDAGFIEFSGSLNPETNEISFSIYNETRGNLGVDAMFAGGNAWQAPGRYAQQQQWGIVLDNAERFLGGETIQKGSLIKDYEWDFQNQSTGVLYWTQESDMLNKTKETKTYNVPIPTGN